MSVFWAAFAGFVFGATQSLVVDWFRNRAQHRRQLRLLRSELRRLAGHRQPFGWTLASGPPTDAVPNPPRITSSYDRLLNETDFWLTDEHRDDNTQQGLIDIADGAIVLARYASDALRLVDEMRAAGHGQKAEYATRAIATAQAYDRELDRWHIIVASALADVERRLRSADFVPQLLRALRPMPTGTNPAPLPPLDSA